MKADSRHVGVSFCGGNLQLAEVEHGRKLQLVSLAQGKSTLDFGQAGVSLSAHHPQLGTMVRELGDLLKRNKIAGRNVSFALPSEPLFLSILPLDPALKGKRLEEHLAWELQQHEPATDARDFVLDAQPLGTGGPDSRPALLVAVRKGMVAFLQQTVQQLKLTLQIVDVDHFSVEHVVRANYPEVKGHVVLQASLRYGGLNVSTLKDGRLVDYRFLPLQNADEMVHILCDYLKHHPERMSGEQPQAILLAGQDVPPEIFKQLRSESRIQVIQINALRKVQVQKDVYEPFLKRSHVFAAAIGLALREPA